MFPKNKMARLGMDLLDSVWPVSCIQVALDGGTRVRGGLGERRPPHGGTACSVGEGLSALQPPANVLRVERAVSCPQNFPLDDVKSQVPATT